jgi:hypothetical protein
VSTQPDPTPALGAAPGSAVRPEFPPIVYGTDYGPASTEDPREFFAPGIMVFIGLSVIFAVCNWGSSAIAMALLAHLLRCMAKDDMPPISDISACAGTEARP